MLLKMMYKFFGCSSPSHDQMAGSLSHMMAGSLSHMLAGNLSHVIVALSLSLSPMFNMPIIIAD
jgi:hypothetical protein